MLVKYITSQTKAIRLILMALLIQLTGLASPSPRSNPCDSCKTFAYRMVSSSDVCPLPPAVTPFDIEYDCRNTTVSVYQAYDQVILGQGFTSEDGASFVVQIVPSAYGVPQATNLTGTADANLNWTQATSFDETGTVIADGKQFYDNIGNVIQSQSKAFYRVAPNTVYTHVLAGQPIRDAYGRVAGGTLPAPIDYADFSYRPNFLQHNSSGSVYNHQNFDLSTGGDKTNSPDPLWDASSGNPVQGTLAWYYSISNTWEPYTPVTNYPYSRQTFYQDGTGNSKKGAGLGDPLKMGSGHEESSYVTPVANELDFYSLVRNQYFATTEIGALPTSLAGQAIQVSSRDANGNEAASFLDRGGMTLMKARPGTGLPVNNTATIDGVSTSDKNIYYFKLFAAGPVGITGGSFALYDMNAESVISGFSSGATLSAGYYKVVNTGTTPLTLTYSNSYTDLSFNFFNQEGQLVATIAPEGVKRLYTNGLGAYATKAAIPYITLYSYDLQGRIASSQDPDAGSLQFVYRKDGKIRFSQNALQSASGSFSYTNYDQWGRPVESGEYKPDGSGISFGSAGMTAILENTAPGGGLTTGTKTDAITTQYDIPDNSHGLGAYVQDAANLAGSVSLTRKYSVVINNSPSAANLVSSTWYNYDEGGKMTWAIRYINGLGYKTLDLTYDVLGHLTKKVFQAATPSETFVHYYEYDPVNKQLWHVYTNTTDNPSTRMLQATYYYFLHGGLKRVELGGNLQGIDYTYTLQGATKAINNSNKAQGQDPGNDGTANGFGSDAFGEVLDYFSGDYVNGRTGVANINGVNASSITTDSYAGNIKAMTWYSEKPPSTGLGDAPTTYVYQYDPKYQFTESTWGTGLNFNVSPASFTTTSLNKEKIGNPTGGVAPYDGNGNIQYLQRTDVNGNASDQFSYQYGNNNNQLTSVTNVATSQPYATYTYDATGQITGENTGDGNQKYMIYDPRGKVTAVYRDAAHTQLVVKFVYDERGERVTKMSYNNSGQLSQQTFYVGDVIYTQSVTNGGPIQAAEYQISGGSRLGTYYAQSNVYTYELKDHLGDVRAVIAQGGSPYQVRMYSDYYPFGMVISKGGTDYRYGYQGQTAEVDPETSWNAFELRMYDSRIARWLQNDPGRQYYSPYVGMGNEPVRSTDPDGGWDWYAHQNADGSISMFNDAGVHDAMEWVGGQYYVNVGEDNIGNDQASANATAYFANPETYAGNYHFQGWDFRGMIENSVYTNRDQFTNLVTSTPWLTTARSELEKGVSRDAIGNNADIMKYLTNTIHNDYKYDQKTPWCACFINWTLNQNGIRGSGSAAAYSFADVGKDGKAQKGYGQKLSQVAVGSILVLDFSHATYAIGRTSGGRIVILGGNQGKDHSITISSVDSNSIFQIRYPSGYTPNYNLPHYEIHGKTLTYSTTH